MVVLDPRTFIGKVVTTYIPVAIYTVEDMLQSRFWKYVVAEYGVRFLLFPPIYAMRYTQDMSVENSAEWEPAIPETYMFHPIGAGDTKALQMLARQTAVLETLTKRVRDRLTRMKDLTSAYNSLPPQNPADETSSERAIRVRTGNIAAGSNSDPVTDTADTGSKASDDIGIDSQDDEQDAFPHALADQWRSLLGSPAFMRQFTFPKWQCPVDDFISAIIATAKGSFTPDDVDQMIIWHLTHMKGWYFR